MNLNQITEVAVNAAAAVDYATTGAAQFWQDMNNGEKSDCMRTAASELGSPIDHAGWLAWLDGKRADGSVQVNHAAFQSVCYTLKPEYDGTQVDLTE